MNKRATEKRRERETFKCHKRKAETRNLLTDIAASCCGMM